MKSARRPVPTKEGSFWQKTAKWGSWLKKHLKKAVVFCLYIKGMPSWTQRELCISVMSSSWFAQTGFPLIVLYCVITANRNTPTTTRCFQWSYHFATLSLAFSLFLLHCITVLFEYLFKAFVFQIFPFSEYNLMYRQSSRLSASWQGW